jgi:hypothetical protein
MDIEKYILPGFILFIVYWLSAKIKILTESQRLAMFKLGIFMGFRGPGLVIQFEKGVHMWMRVTVGAVGELIDSGMGRFEEKKSKFFDLPVEMSDSARIGSLIRITGFSADKALCVMNPDQRKTIRCEKCGHEMTLS